MSAPRNRAPSVSLFPFLSILVCMMGVLAFITVAIGLLSATNPNVRLTEQKRAAGNGTDMVPIWVECHGDRMVLHPEDRQVALEDMQQPASPFMELVERLAQERDHEYVIFAVFPDGVPCFRDARRVMERRNLDLGFEPMEAGWQIQFDQPTPGES